MKTLLFFLLIEALMLMSSAKPLTELPDTQQNSSNFEKGALFLLATDVINANIGRDTILVADETKLEKFSNDIFNFITGYIKMVTPGMIKKEHLSTSKFLHLKDKKPKKYNKGNLYMIIVGDMDEEAVEDLIKSIQKIDSDAFIAVIHDIKINVKEVYQNATMSNFYIFNPNFNVDEVGSTYRVFYRLYKIRNRCKYDQDRVKIVNMWNSERGFSLQLQFISSS